jgi:hypothetical protein
MVVMWCKNCGALLGLREPLADWSTERTGFCRGCAEYEKGHGIKETDAVNDGAANIADDIDVSGATDDRPPAFPE